MMKNNVMKLAMNLAERKLGLTGEKPAVGAVLLGGGDIIALASTTRDFHAEELLLEKIKDRTIPKTAELYLSLEPCMERTVKTKKPCVHLLLESGIKKIHIAHEDLNPATHGKSIMALKQAGVEITMADEVIKNHATKIYQGFFYRITEQRPWVAVKIAVDKNGYSIPPRPPYQITKDQLQFFAQYIRCRYDAMLVSANTVKHDNPLLTIRDRGLPHDNKPRFILDGENILTGDEKIFATTAEQPLGIFNDKSNLSLDEEKHFAWGDILRRIATRGINRLLIETGGGMLDSLKKNNLPDELWICQQHDVVLDSGAKFGGGDYKNIDEWLAKNKWVAGEIYQFGAGEARRYWLTG